MRLPWVLSPTGKDYNPDSSKGCCGVKVISTDGLDPEERENQKLKITDAPLPDCKENRNHDYLNQIFNIKRLDIKNRKKKGLVVASQLKY
ncbi:hypothetical protein ACU5DF_00620 [Aliivibrio wodanis]|uniref:hypothetical protein n=1 Tax=Aliivibrio wodanis TaxID=80852 RepID=UPI00406D2D93